MDFIYRKWYDFRSFFDLLKYDSLSDFLSALYLRHIAFNEKKQIEFIKEFNEWVQAGSQPKRACEAIIRVYSEQRKNIGGVTIEEKIAQSILEALEAGKTVSKGMEKYFNSEVVALFEVGEKSATLGEMMNTYTKDKDDLSRIKSDGKKMFLYPLIISLVVMVVYSLIGRALPDLMLKINMNALTSPIRFMFGLAEIIYRYSFIFFAFYYLVKFSYNHSKKNWLSYEYDEFNEFKPTLRMTFDRYFPFTLFREYSAMIMLKNMALLAKTKMTLKDSCLHLMENENPYMKQHYQMIISKLHKDSGNAGNFLDTGLLYPRLKQFLLVVSEVPSEDSKIKAILVAGDKSTNIFYVFQRKINLFLCVLAWLLIMFLFGTLILGGMDMYFNLTTIFKR